MKVFYSAAVDPGQARVAARLSDGTPLLLDRQLGEGHVLLFTSGLDNLTNDLPLHPMFVAFVDRTARYLSGNERLSGSRLVDSFVQLRGTAEPVGVSGSVEVIDPEGRETALAQRSAHRADISARHARLLPGSLRQWTGCRDRRQSRPARVRSGADAGRSRSSYGAEGQWRTRQTSGAAPAEAKYSAVSLWWWVMLLALARSVGRDRRSPAGYMGTQREEP